MLQILSENLGSIIVGIIVLAIFILAVLKVVRDKRSLSCSCGGNCSGCSSCGVCNQVNDVAESSIKSSEIKIKRIK